MLDFSFGLSNEYQTKGDVSMDKKQAEKEMDYRIGKIVLATLLAEGLITAEVYETARQSLMLKIKPLIGSLEPPNGA